MKKVGRGIMEIFLTINGENTKRGSTIEKLNGSNSNKGYPACSVWGYKDESINGAHDGTYTEENRKDSTRQP